jgi:hypothetical protein
LNQLGFQQNTDAAYLVSAPLSALAKFVNIFIRYNVAVIFISLLIFLPFQYYRKDVLSRQLVTINLALLVLFGCMLISGIFNIPKNWYDAGYMYALMLIVLVFFIGENFPNIFFENIYKRIFIYLGLVALLSQAIFVQRNLPAFLSGYAGPGVPTVNYDVDKVRTDIRAAAEMCEIDSVHGKKIVVDDHTYLYLQSSKYPMAITYIWQIPDDRSRREFFSKADSDGLITGCTGLLDSFQSIVRKSGGICCISKKDLGSLNSTP